MNVQPLNAEDLNFVRELQPPDWSNIVPIHEYYLNSKFCYPVKIIIDKKIVGIGTTVIHHDAAWLAHIIVNPEYRNHGIGRFITAKLIEIAGSNNKETIYLLATELGAPVYKKLGFETEIEYAFYNGGSIDSGWESHPNIQPYTSQYKNQVFALDTLSTGENRAIRLEEHIENSLLYINNNKVEGFYMPGFGEGLIIACTTISGISLMKLRLIKNSLAVLPRNNKPAVDFLLQNGFKEFRKAERMRLGKPRSWQPGNFYNRVSGQIG